MLIANHIGLTIRQRVILSDVSLALKPGTITAILGPNGAGKSSLLRILSGEWKGTCGTVQLNGKPMDHFSARELGRIRAFLPQESSLDFSFSVLEVVLLGRSPHMHGSERPEDYALAREALQVVDLLDRENDLYTNLSGGEKQRVHLARVLVQIRAPEVREDRYLLLDEPTNNLDLTHQKAIFEALRQAVDDRLGACVILHDLNHAIRVADQIIVMRTGSIALSGSPQEIAHSHRLQEIFGVGIERVSLPGRELPYLVFS